MIVWNRWRAFFAAVVIPMTGCWIYGMICAAWEWKLQNWSLTLW